MNIILFYEFLSEQGGLERELINHANFLREEGYNVAIMTCHKSKDIQKLLPFGDLKIIEVSLIKTPLQTLNLALSLLGLNKVGDINADLFISYSAPCNFLLRKKKQKKINYVNHYPHYLYLEGKEKIEWANSFDRKISVFLSLILGKWLKKIDKKLLRENKLLFTNSLFTKKRIDSIYGVNTLISYPPIDPRIKTVKSLIDKKFIFSCGRIIPDKKFEWLIQSCSMMKNKLPLYVAGQGDQRYLNSLKSIANKSGVNLIFLGKLKTEEIIKYYSSAELFAFPTPGEDFGLVPAESITCGTPCVVWDDGSGPTEQIIDGVNGFYARPFELKDFADKMDKIINTKLKISNKKKILDSAKKFSSEEIKKDFVKKIESILYPLNL